MGLTRFVGASTLSTAALRLTLLVEQTQVKVACLASSRGSAAMGGDGVWKLREIASMRFFMNFIGP